MKRHIDNAEKVWSFVSLTLLLGPRSCHDAVLLYDYEALPKKDQLMLYFATQQDNAPLNSCEMFEQNLGFKKANSNKSLKQSGICFQTLQNPKFPKMILLGHFVFLFNTVNVIFEEKCDNWNDSGWQTRVYWKTVRFILAALANEHRKSGTSSKSTTSKCRTSAASPYNYI